MVVWDRNLYLQEADRTLSDTSFYEKLDRDFIMDYNKIHKPGNPGRPIVSACNCPTELIATYLDVITTPLVQSLPSYVKDTNHMLRIADSFRFPGTSNYVFTMDVMAMASWH